MASPGARLRLYEILSVMARDSSCEVKKTCVHIVHPDGRIIPFDTYNLFYRDGLETSRLAPLRARAAFAVEGGSRWA
jgi:hypothetical protein